MRPFRVDRPSRPRLLAASPLLRTLAFGMILVLLAVRCGSFSEELFITPVEDAIFSVAFVVADGEGEQTRLSAVKSKRALDCVLPPSGLARTPPAPTPVPPPGYVPVFFYDDVAGEIFVPPEGLC